MSPLLVLLLPTLVSAHLRPVQPNYRDSLVPPAILITTRSFPDVTQTVSITIISQPSYKTQVLPLVDSFVKELEGQYVVLRIEDSNHLRHHSPRRFSVMFVDRFESFKEFSETKLTKKNYNFSGRFVIILISEYHWGSPQLSEIMQILWQRYIVNVSLVIKQPHSTNVLIYTYFPFWQHFCEVPQVLLWNRFVNGSFLYQNEFFPQKLINLHGCRLTMAVALSSPFTKLAPDGSITGFEGELTQALARTINFSINTIVDSKDKLVGYIYPNGTSIGTISHIYYQRANFGIGFFDLSQEKIKFLDFVISYHSEPLVFCAPLEDNPSHLRFLSSPFHWKLWAVIAAFWIGTNLLIIGMGLKCGKCRNFVVGRNVQTPVLNVFSILLGNSVNAVPSGNFARTMFMLYGLLFMVLRNAYMGAVYVGFQKEGRRITDVSQMIDNGVRFVALENYKNYFDGLEMFKRADILYLNNRTTYNQIKNQSLEPGSKYSPMATRTHIKNQNFERFKTIALVPSQQDITTMSITIFLNRFSVLTDIFNHYTFKFIENGLIEKFRKQFFFFIRKESTEPTPLSLKTLSGCFTILGLGYLLAFVVFIGELIFHRMTG